MQLNSQAAIIPKMWRPGRKSCSCCFRHRRDQILAILVLLTFVLSVRAQLSAQSEAPKLRACAILNARFTVREFRDTNSASKLDTARIQDALNLCSPGQVVVLTAHRSKNAFLSAPLVLPRGVKLFIDEGVTLYASRNPRDYDLSPSSCGSVTSSNVPSCKPFLFAYQAAYSGVIGYGTIDGQRGKALAGGRRSWWDMVHTNRQISVPDLVSSYESQGFTLSGVTLKSAAGHHAAIFKTIGFMATDLKIESPADSVSSGGMLLSNSPQADIENLWVQIPSQAISIQGSILGSTSHVSIHDVHIFGGGGVSIGDDTYGAVDHVSVDGLTISNAQTGLSFDLKGSRGGPVEGIQFSRVCLANVLKSIQVEKQDGSFDTSLPTGHNIVLCGVVVDGKSQVDPNASSDMHCGISENLSQRPKFSFSLDLSHLATPGSKHSVVVAQDGSGDFTSVQQAVDALPARGGEIAVKPGTYREVVTIRKRHLHLYGVNTDPAKTVIVFGNGAPSSGGTFNTATMFVEADDARVDHLTIENDFGGKGQAIALSVTADRAIFRHVRILGGQDTLFAASKYCYGDYGPCALARQYFADCYIEGNVDFIFGDSKAFFDHCELHGISKGNVMFTAQSRHAQEQASGYVFDHCRLTADPGPRLVSLGRPWRPYATVVYLSTEINAPITPSGWTEWPRFGVPSLPTAFYAESNSTGPGANLRRREPYSHQLSAKGAERWSVSKFLSPPDGWNPSTSP